MTARRNRRISRPAVPASRTSRSTWDLLLWNHKKLWIGVSCGVAVAAVTPSSWSVLARVLSGWNSGILVMLPLVIVWARGLGAKQLRARYIEEDPTAPVILLAVVAGALLSVIAIVALLATLKQVGAAQKIAHILLACLTIVNSWLLVHMMFTLHYADKYYSVTGDTPPPLIFPDTREPLFWDFVYFAFTIGVACQTADVATTRTDIRRIVVLHSIIAFVFNVSILGFAINVSAGLLGGGS